MRPRLTQAALVVSAALVVTTVRPVLATEPAPASLEAPPVIGAEATSATRDLLISEARRARYWRYAWIGINGGLAAGSFALLPYSERNNWPELIVGGIGSVASTVLTVAWPLDVEAAPDELARAAASGDGRRADQLMLAYGRDERDRLRWPWHALNVGVGLAYFGILGLGWGHWENGALAGATAFAIGEIQTLTQPSRLADATASGRTWQATATAGPSGRGGQLFLVALHGHF